MYWDVMSDHRNTVFTHLSLLAQHNADICFLCSVFVINKCNHTNKWDQLLFKRAESTVSMLKFNFIQKLLTVMKALSPRVCGRGDISKS